ncbi:Homeobox protein HD-4 [Cucumispora dikerogammari]|nr:Homeobox protein HD-4 [Cucumispora dikerogammari]
MYSRLFLSNTNINEDTENSKTDGKNSKKENKDSSANNKTKQVGEKNNSLPDNINDKDCKQEPESLYLKNNISRLDIITVSNVQSKHQVSIDEEATDILFELMRLKMDTTHVVETAKTQVQLNFLLNISHITSFPSTETKHDISYISQMQYKTVSIWFQNNRQRKRGMVGSVIIDDNYKISRKQLFDVFQKTLSLFRMNKRTV